MIYPNPAQRQPTRERRASWATFPSVLDVQQ